jgi:hypothetical protein
MNAPDCPLEERVAEAARRGDRDPHLDAHRRDCAVCADRALVEAHLAASAAAALLEATPPDAGSLWWRARFRARVQDAERAAWAIHAFERLTWGIGPLVAAGVLFWRWEAVRPAVGRFFAGWRESAAAAASSAPQGPVSQLVVIGALGLFVVLFGVYSAWTEE